MYVELTSTPHGLMQCRIRHHGAVLLTALIDPQLVWPMAERLVRQAKALRPMKGR